MLMNLFKPWRAAFVEEKGLFCPSPKEMGLCQPEGKVALATESFPKALSVLGHLLATEAAIPRCSLLTDGIGLSHTSLGARYSSG